jgi:hypothetical protein
MKVFFLALHGFLGGANIAIATAAFTEGFYLPVFIALTGLVINVASLRNLW